MVNLRSRNLPDVPSGTKVESPRVRRASSVQPDSPRNPSSSSVEPEGKDTPGGTRSLRKSSRLNSPIVFSKTVKTNLFAVGTKEEKSKPATIAEEMVEWLGETKDKTLAKRSETGNEEFVTKNDRRSGGGTKSSPNNSPVSRSGGSTKSSPSKRNLFAVGTKEEKSKPSTIVEETIESPGETKDKTSAKRSDTGNEEFVTKNDRRSGVSTKSSPNNSPVSRSGGSTKSSPSKRNLFAVGTKEGKSKPAKTAEETVESPGETKDKSSAKRSDTGNEEFLTKNDRRSGGGIKSSPSKTKLFAVGTKEGKSKPAKTAEETVESPGETKDKTSAKRSDTGSEEFVTKNDRRSGGSTKSSPSKTNLFAVGTKEGKSKPATTAEETVESPGETKDKSLAKRSDTGSEEFVTKNDRRSGGSTKSSPSKTNLFAVGTKEGKSKPATTAEETVESPGETKDKSLAKRSDTGSEEFVTKNDRRSGGSTKSSPSKTNLFAVGTKEGKSKPAKTAEETVESPGETKDKSLAKRSDTGSEEFVTKNDRRSGGSTKSSPSKTNWFAVGTKEGKSKPATTAEETVESPGETKDKSLAKRSDTGNEEFVTKNDLSPVVHLIDVMKKSPAGRSGGTTKPSPSKTNLFAVGTKEEKSKPAKIAEETVKSPGETKDKSLAKRSDTGNEEFVTKNDSRSGVGTKSSKKKKKESLVKGKEKKISDYFSRKPVSDQPTISPTTPMDVTDDLVLTNDGNIPETSVAREVNKNRDTPREVSDGFKVPQNKTRLRRRPKTDSEKKRGLGKVGTESEAVSCDKDVPGEHNRKNKDPDTQNIKAPEPHDEIRTDYAAKMGDSEVTVRRRGGGTIIGSRPVFSDDAKYVYVNCGWGVRVFSIETGECVRVFDAYSKDHKVVACFCWKSCPAALTSEGLFIAWDPRSGRVQQKVRLKVQELVVDGFFIPDGPETILCLVLDTKKCCQLRAYSGTTFRSLRHLLNDRKIGHPYNLHHVSVGGQPESPFIAYITHNNKLKVLSIKGTRYISGVKAGDKKSWTCVRCHPTEKAVAVGDSIGRILVYWITAGDKTKNQVSSMYHWHTLPVSEIAFTPAGSSMYSGGGELTLVKWNLENPHIKNYLPRLSADIVHIAISPYNQMIAVATLDNGIQIVTPNNKLHCVLQQLSWSVFAGEQEGMFPAGLVYDPRSRGLMLNGRPGHLQLYSPLSETLTYNIDVTMMNYLTQVRDKVIVNTHVTHSALTSDGLWLATVETRYEPGQALELKLKYWEYDGDKKRYVLATVIDMPHDGKVHTIKFSPGTTGSVPNNDVSSDLEVVLASTGADKKLRFWSKTPIDSIYQKGSTWRCQNACFYRDRSCGPCSFSYDGSVLAVGFSSVLTLWDVDNVVLKQTIARDNKELKFVEFGRGDCCHILMCATDSNIVAWNLLTLSLVWQVETRTALFVPDPYSYFFAIFTVENQWKILDAHNGEVVYKMNSDGKSEVGDQPAKSQVLAAVFAPRHRPNPDAPQWMKNSYLYYVDIYQELNCLEPANEISQLPTFQLAVDKDAATPFASLVGAKSVREPTEEDHTNQAVGYGVLGFQAVTQLLRPPAHTLPPVSLLCGSFLQSFVIMKRDAPQVDSDKEDKSEDDKTTVVASSDSEGETNRPAEPVQPAKTGKSPKARRRKSNKLKKTEADEPMETLETQSIDLRKHFPPLDEDDADGMFVIDD